MGVTGLAGVIRFAGAALSGIGSPHLGHSTTHPLGALLIGDGVALFDEFIFYFLHVKSFAAADAVDFPAASHSALISWGCSY